MHLLIPFASSDAPDCRAILRALELPNLEKLLGRLAPADTDTGSADHWSPPHERALARLHAIPAPDGCLPWAALEVAQAGRNPGSDAWAWITPTHWEVGTVRIEMPDPQLLGLQEAESRALVASMQPYFAEDGIELEYAAPQRWLARGSMFGDLASASLDRVAGREISGWMPSAASLLRLQNEMQMLLYTHPVNDARSARGLATVNSIWVSGTGRLAPSAVVHRPADLVVVDELRQAALRNDWAAWAAAWTQVDQQECASALQSLAGGHPVTLTLCGERNALELRPQGGLLEGLRRRLRRNRLQQLQDDL